MKRGGPLRRKRSLAQVSNRRWAGADDRRAVREQVFARDRVCVLLEAWRTDPDVPQCFGEPRTPHHLLKASQGGDYSVENLVTLCAGHNEWVERDRAAARRHGLVVDRGETSA